MAVRGSFYILGVLVDEAYGDVLVQPSYSRRKFVGKAELDQSSLRQKGGRVDGRIPKSDMALTSHLRTVKNAPWLMLTLKAIFNLFSVSVIL